MAFNKDFLYEYLDNFKKESLSLWLEMAQVVKEADRDLRHIWRKNFASKGADALAAGVPLMGSRFRSIAIVGLTKSELVPSKSEASLYAEHWQDMVDDSMRKNLAMLFFAPRDLSNQPVNPYLFLGGEDLEEDDEDEQAIFLQTLSGISLFDFCRLPPAPTEHVGVIGAGDVLFHWDGQDNYISPTSTNSWPSDLQRIMDGYPKNYTFTFYSNWNRDMLMDRPKNLVMQTMHELPLNEEAWVNKPTFQEKHGNSVLVASVIFAALCVSGLFMQKQQIMQLDEDIAIVEQQIPREGRYMRLLRPIREQEAQMRYRHLFPYIIKDVAESIHLSKMKVDNFEVRNPKPQSPPTQMIATIEAERDAYKGWLQEEPIAKAILMNSTTFEGLRKPPGNTFKLEGLVELRSFDKALKAALKRQVDLSNNANNAQQGEGE